MMVKTNPAGAERQKLIPSFDINEKVQKRVPKPPAVPNHAMMRPASEQWVREVRYLAGEVDAMVRDTRITNRIDQSRRVELEKQKSTGLDNLDVQVTRTIKQTSREVKGIDVSLAPLEEELKKLLQVRARAIQKVESIERPLKTIERRIAEREKAIAGQENNHDSVERALHLAAVNLKETASEIGAHIVKAESLVAHMNNLRGSLLESREDKTIYSAVNEMCFSAREVGDADFQPSPRGADTLPPLPKTARKNPRVPKGDTRWAMSVSKTAISNSMELRAKIQTSCKAATNAIDSTTKSVEASLQRKIKDATALRDVLHSKMAVLRAEIIEVDRQREQLIRENATYIATVDPTLKKTQGRKQGAPLREVRGFDPIRDAANDEVRVLRKGKVEFDTQLSRLDAQKAKMEKLLSVLEGAASSKEDLAKLDTRILTMGNTPSIRSGRSGRTVSSPRETSSQRSSQRSGRQ